MFLVSFWESLRRSAAPSSSNQMSSASSSASLPGALLLRLFQSRELLQWAYRFYSFNTTRFQSLHFKKIDVWWSLLETASRCTSSSFLLLPRKWLTSTPDSEIAGVPISSVLEGRYVLERNVFHFIFPLLYACRHLLNFKTHLQPEPWSGLDPGGGLSAPSLLLVSWNRKKGGPEKHPQRDGRSDSRGGRSPDAGRDRRPCPCAFWTPW